MGAEAVPTFNLTAEARNCFKKELGLDLTTSIEACSHQKVHDYIQKCLDSLNPKLVSRAANIRKFTLIS